MPDSRILLVEDDQRYGARLRSNLTLEGYQVELADSAESAQQALARDSFELVVSDIKMPGRDGLALLNAIRSGDLPGVERDLPVIMLTSIQSVETAVEATRAGANDYVLKDWGRQEICLRIEKVLTQHHLWREHRVFRDLLAGQGPHGEIVSASSAMQQVLEETRQIAATSATVLITGPTGVGKELVARAIHALSPRGDHPFVVVNCAALPEDDKFLSEIFGHEKGAFTGALQLKQGKFEIAQGGTIFLDEVGELSLEAQAKLLRVIEHKEFERLGGTRKIRVDVRFVLATNRKLTELVNSGRFRNDLYYRINVAAIVIPPLAERVDDIRPLADYFLQQFTAQYRKTPRTWSPEAGLALARVSWPGNVRELRNVVERLVIRGGAGPITPEELPLGERLGAEAAPGGLVNLPAEGAALDELERQAVLLALERSGYNQTKAAQLLRISPDRLHTRAKKFGISHPSWKKQE